MAKQYNVAGSLLVRSCVTGGSLSDLGYTRGGLQIVERRMTGGIKTDYWGGDEGPDGDVQYFGEEHDFRMELTLFDPAILTAIMQAASANPANTAPGYPGKLLRQNSSFLVIAFVSTNFNRSYPVCLVRQFIEFNEGSKFSSAMLAATAYASAPQTALWS